MKRRRHTRRVDWGLWIFVLLVVAFAASRWSVIAGHLGADPDRAANSGELTAGLSEEEATASKPAPSAPSAPPHPTSPPGSSSLDSSRAPNQAAANGADITVPERDGAAGDSGAASSAGVGASGFEPGSAARESFGAEDGGAKPGWVTAPPGGTNGPPLALVDRLLGEDLATLLPAQRALGREDAFLTSAEALLLADLGELELRHLLRREDPLRERRAAFFEQLAHAALDDVEAALRYERGLVATLRHAEALALAEAARVDGATLPGWEERLEEFRDELFRSSTLRTELRGHGVPASAFDGTRPDSAGPSVGSRLDVATGERLRRERAGEAPRETRGRLTIEAELSGTELYDFLAAADAALEHTAERWSLDDDTPLLISVQPTRRAFDQRLARPGSGADDADADAAPPPSGRSAKLTFPGDALAVLDGNTIVILDPRLGGETLTRGHRLAAREIARWTLRRRFVAEGRPGLPAWLEEGLARGYAGWRPRASTADEWRAGIPLHLLDRVRLDVAGRGAGPATLDDLLQLAPSSEESGAAAWSFVRHLEQALDEDGAPLFANQLATLVAERDVGWTPDGKSELLKHFTHTPAQRLAGVNSLSSLQAHWLRAVTADERDDGVAPLLAHVDTLLAAKAYDAAADLLSDLARRAPLDPAVQESRLRSAERRKARDEIALTGLLLARLSDSDATRDDAWKRASSVSRGLAKPLREHDEEAQAAAAELLDAYRAADRPHGARLLIERLLVAQPSQGAWWRLHAEAVAGEDELPLRVHPLVHAGASLPASQAWLWEQRHQRLDVVAEDAVALTQLRGLWTLRPPYTLRAILELENVLGDGGLQRLGLSFGARDEIDAGDWAVFLEPTGRVSLGTRGGLEWPARGLVRASRPRDVALTLQVDPEGFVLSVGDRELPWRAAGTRRLAGGLGVLAQRISGRLRELSIDLRPRPAPGGEWALVGGR